MNLSSFRARLPQRLALFSFLTLSVLLLLNNPEPLAADKAAQPGWRFSIESGSQKRSNVAMNNRCLSPHRFRIKSNVKYLRFERPTDAILIGPAATEQVGAVFDATNLKPKVYRDKVVVECLDCKKERGCSQDRDELTVEMTVMVPNIYSYCVEVRLTLRPSGGGCKVVSISPKFEPGPCGASFLTIPNNGTPVPKVGTILTAGVCAAAFEPSPKVKLPGDIKKP